MTAQAVGVEQGECSRVFSAKRGQLGVHRMGMAQAMLAACMAG